MGTRAHHETILQSLETLAILAPGLVVTAAKLGQAVKATIARVKGGAVWQ